MMILSEDQPNNLNRKLSLLSLRPCKISLLLYNPSLIPQTLSLLIQTTR